MNLAPEIINNNLTYFKNTDSRKNGNITDCEIEPVKSIRYIEI